MKVVVVFHCTILIKKGHFQSEGKDFFLYNNYFGDFDFLEMISIMLNVKIKSSINFLSLFSLATSVRI